jgi:hypothetical protein
MGHLQMHRGQLTRVCGKRLLATAPKGCGAYTGDTMKKILVLALVWAISAGESAAASCSAQNELDPPDVCSIDCPSGQAAECSNTNGAVTPSCECRGDLSDWLKMKMTPLPASAKPAISTLNITSSNTILQTDALGVVNQRLAGLRDYDLGESCRVVREPTECNDSCTKSVPLDLPGNLVPLRDPGGPACRPRTCYSTSTQCNRIIGKLTVSGPLQPETAAVVRIAEPNWKDIPTELLGLKESYRNCGPVAQSMTFNHAERTRVGHRVTKTKLVSTGHTINAEVNFKFEVFGGKSGISFNRRVDVTSAMDETDEHEETMSYSLPVNIPANSDLVITHTWIKRIVPVRYEGTVRLNAPVAANREGIATIAQVLPEPERRTFDFSGTVSTAMLMEGRTENHIVALKPADCISPMLTITRERIFK